MLKKITNDIFSVGILNPNLRVFDIIMKTDYGTSYNSYIVKGSEKTALVEASHLSYEDNFFENVENVVKIEDIDYLIMNHNEPDHSGAIRALIGKNPNITIITSQAGGIYLKNITNICDVKIKTVKDGDSISLGNKTINFINAPFLHWPDSMFSYVVEDKTLFSCDFFGTHFCEPLVFDHIISYMKEYEE
jgi:flavorubredoxin